MSKYKNFFYRNGSQRVLMHTNMWEPLFQSTGTRVELLDHGVTCTQFFLRNVRCFQSLIPVYISAGSGWVFLMSLLHPHFCLVPSLCFRVHKYRKFEYFPVALMCISLTINGFEHPFIYFFMVKCLFVSLPTCTLDFKLICRIYLSPVLIFCHFMCCKHLRVFILFLTLCWIFCWTEFLISALLNLSIFSFMISTICILISPCLSWSHQNISSLLFLWIFIILSLSFYYDLSLCCDVSI